MQAYQCVVDGQQRLATIRDFVDGKLNAGGKLFSEYRNKEREEFLKYEVAVIDFDLEAGDDRLKEIFHRLNRTYYSLSAIEKIASEYSASEFLLVARVLSGEISKVDDDQEVEANEVDEVDEVDDPNVLRDLSNRFARDPGIDEETWSWLINRADGKFASIIQQKQIFTPLEFDRKVPLMFALNVMCTYLTGYYNRNDRVRKLLEDKNDEFAEKDEVVTVLNSASCFIRGLDLPEDSIWWSKANFFSLMCEVAREPRIIAVGVEMTRERLLSFASALPEDYALAAREAVGRKSQRELRAKAIRSAILVQTDITAAPAVK